jgi:uncharacterized membrane protein
MSFSRRAGNVLVGIVALTFVVVTTGITWLEHQTYNSTSLDIGVYSQLVWNLANGRPFETTLLLQNRLHLAEHLALLLLPLAPLYALLPDVRLLLLLQQAALGLSGLAVYWLAARTLPPVGAVAVAAGYYLMPSLTEVALDAFYPIVFAAVPIGWALALAAHGVRATPVLLGLAALLIEEEAALLTVGIGLFLLGFVCRGRRAGALALVCGLLWLGVNETLIMPAYQPASAANETRAETHFAELRERPLDWSRRVLVNRLEPELLRGNAWLGQYGLPERCTVGAAGHCSALRWWLYPTGGLALLSPATLVSAAPSAAALLLADRPGRFRRHWVAPMLPALWISAALGLARLARWRRGLALGVGLLLCSSLVMYRLDSSLPFGKQFEPDDLVWSPGGRDLDQLRADLPPDASLATGRRGLAHFANRRWLYALPPQYSASLWPPAEWPRYVLIDLERDEDQARLFIGRPDSPPGKPPYVELARNEHALLLRAE